MTTGKRTWTEISEEIRHEREAEILTDLAAEMCNRAAHAWDAINNGTHRDRCESARRLLPGQLP